LCPRRRASSWANIMTLMAFSVKRSNMLMSFHHQFVLDQYVLVEQCYHRETVGLWRTRQRQWGDCHTFAVAIFALRNGKDDRVETQA
jgi:hypothetical protein